MGSLSFLRIILQCFLIGMLVQVEARWSGGGSGNSCSCGRSNGNDFQSRIAGGVEAQPNEFPWRCYLQFQGIFFCGCTLISNRWVMTAAHCMDAIGGQIPDIVLGAHDREDGAAVMMTMSPVRVVTHPRYNSTTLRNDITLMELSESITPSREISPVCLPWNMAHWNFAESTGVTSGWGWTSSANQVANNLQKVDLSVVSNQLCARLLGTNGNGIFPEMICGLRLGGGGVCRGDSGSSMDFRRRSRYYAIGVTSAYLEPCSQGFSAFARVTRFLNWIQDTTRN